MTATESTAVAKTSISSGGQIAAFVPQSLDEAWRLAGALAGSGMTPKAYGNDQNKVMVGIMAGAELGLTPFAALQSIAVIGNNPAVWGDGLLALVEASGKMADIHETDDGNEATCRVERVGRKTPIVRTFSMEDAKKAGLAGKSGPWSQYPKRMRQMRARAFALRDGFSDVIRGMKTVEEVRDYVSIDGGQISNAKPITAAALIEQASAEPEPEAAEEVNTETGEIVEDAAVVWKNDFITGVNKQPVIDSLESLLLRAEKTLASLGKKRPELHAECVHAIAMKRESFGIEGGRSDEMHGENFNGTEGDAASDTVDGQGGEG
jgi:hypothetical protein